MTRLLFALTAVAILAGMGAAAEQGGLRGGWVDAPVVGRAVVDDVGQIV
jgi:hypothetical protein